MQIETAAPKEVANARSTKYSTPAVKSQKNIWNMRKSKVLTTQNECSLIGLGGGLVKMDIKREPMGGMRLGKRGCVKMSTGNWQEVEIRLEETGLACVPPLKERDWRLIDDEIAREKYDNRLNTAIAVNDEVYWGQVLIQGQAALLTSPFENTLMRLTRLKLQKPTQSMNEQATAVFLEDITEHLEKRDYSYFAIDQGITALIEQEDDKFFPTMKVLLKYIHPIHWKLKKRIAKIEEMLKRNIK